MGTVRILLACCVVFFHATPWSGLRLMSGQIAVEFFFMISGFYMALICERHYDVSTTQGRWAFYAARFLRLWPVFIIATALQMAVTVIAAWWMGHWPTGRHLWAMLDGHPITMISIVVSNVTMIGQDALSWFALTPAKTIVPSLQPLDGPFWADAMWLGYGRMISSAWSIGTEIWFYLLVPFLVRRSIVVLIALIGAGLALRFSLDLAGLDPLMFSPAQLPMFLFGVLAYRHSPVPSHGLAGIGFAAALAAIFLMPLLAVPQEAAKWLLFAVFAAGMSSLFAVSSKSRVDRLVGELSYPVYLLHRVVLSALIYIGHRFGFAPSAEAVLIPTIAMSLVLTIFVEAPINRYRKRFYRS